MGMNARPSLSGSPNYPVTRMSFSGRPAAVGADGGGRDPTAGSIGKWSYSAAMAYAAKEAEATAKAAADGVPEPHRPGSASALVPTLARKTLQHHQPGGGTSLSRSSLTRLQG